MKIETCSLPAKSRCDVGTDGNNPANAFGGAAASITYSGYAHFDSDEFVDWIAESGLPKNPEHYGVTRRALDGVAGDAEYALKSQVNYGGARYAGFGPAGAKPAANRAHQNFGLLVVSCDGADLRPTSKGVMIYDDRERRLEAVAVPPVPRREVIDELYAAVVDGLPPVHDGRWGLATMEVCFAILKSLVYIQIVVFHEFDKDFRCFSATIVGKC